MRFRVLVSRRWIFMPFLHVNKQTVLLYVGDDDATDSQCTIESVPNIFEGDILNHLGPYEGISIGTLSCDP